MISQSVPSILEVDARTCMDASIWVVRSSECSGNGGSRSGRLVHGEGVRNKSKQGQRTVVAKETDIWRGGRSP